MSEVMLTLGRTSTIYENYDVPASVPEVVTRGPFPYVELTYDLLRIGPEGDTIGAFREGAWYLTDDPHPFSDMDIHPPTMTT